MNLKQLLALPLAFAVAWALAFSNSKKQSSPDWNRALNDVKSIGFVVQHRFASDSDVSTGAIYRWLNDSTSPLDPSVVAKTPAPGVDPWGNEFQVALRQDADGNRTYGVYSLGRDGESASGGNDPDDINSWSLDPVAFYIPELVQELNLSRALWTIPWLLVVYPLMFILLRTRKLPS